MPVRKAIALLAVLVLAVVVEPGPAAAAEPEPSFCASRTLRDYLAPLKRMPKLRELPFRRRGEGRFRGVHIGTAGPSLAVNGGRAGYQLQWDKNPEWEIAVSLARMRPNGTVLRSLGQRRIKLGSLGPALVTEPGFRIPGGPALYRSTLVIRAPSGRKLAEFGNYYRVVRPSIDVHLVPDAGSFRPGETVLARVENSGASFVLFGDEYKIEQLQGASWIPAPGAPGPYVAPLQFVGPGTTSAQCLDFPIPASSPAGQYRIAQETVLSWPFETRERRPILYADFEVTAP